MESVSLFHISLFSILVNSLVQAQGLDDVSVKISTKPKDFKAKLAKTEFAETLKNSKLLSAIRPASYDSSPSDLGISLPPDQANDTVAEDNHTYYTSAFYTSPDSKQFWVTLDKFPEDHVITHEMLSDSHRQATTIELTFEFPFYGNLIRNITIATGGFLYMGDYLHNWIAATQYIAPLMANFDTSISPESTIQYYDNGTVFIVQWNKVFVQGKANEGGFTFQVSLFKNGDIVFAYKEIPYSVLSIPDTQHPVKIGISDAYILEKSMFFVRRKTIYEYHRVDMMNRSIANDTAIYFIAQTTCMQYKDCESCVSADQKLGCLWCDTVQRCSDGIDRKRQSWVTNRCVITAAKTCPAGLNETTTEKSSSFESPEKSTDISSKHATSKSKYETSVDDSHYNSGQFIPSSTSSEGLTQEVAPFVQEKTTSQTLTAGAIATIVCFIIMLMGASAWIAYAYKFPQTSSGQFLIKYRPSQWTLKKEENNPTNDSLHM